MAGIIVALHRLQIVALHQKFADISVVFRRFAPLEFGKWRLTFCWSHVGPNQTASFHAWIRCNMDFFFERVSLWCVGNVCAVAIDVKLPSVVNTTESAFFVSAIEHRCTTMRAILVHQTDFPIGVAESDQMLSQKGQLHRSAIGP